LDRCERALPTHWQAPLGLYVAFSAAPSGRTPSRQNRHNATSSFLGRALNWDQTAGSAVLRRFGCRGDRAMRRHALRDDQWERIKDLLPGRDGHVGVTAKDNRLFVEAVLFRYRAGLPWRDLPERFGDWKKVHTRFCRWAKAGVWARIFQHLADEADNEWAMIDSTIVRAHQHSAGAAKKTAVMKPSGAAGAA
jgi:transposase